MRKSATIYTIFCAYVLSYGQLIEQRPTGGAGLISNTASNVHAAENFLASAGDTIASVTVWTNGLAVPQLTVVFWDSSGSFPGSALTAPQTLTTIATPFPPYTRLITNLTTPFMIPSDGTYWVQVYAPTDFTWHGATIDPVTGVSNAASQFVSTGIWGLQGIEASLILRNTTIPVELQTFSVE